MFPPRLAPMPGKPDKLSGMATVTFDTLKFVKTLQSAGVDAPQAEAIAAAVRDSSESAELATKSDLRQIESSTKAEFALLRAEMREQLNEALYALTWKLIGVAGALVAAVYFIARTVH
jgi:hypothetical protein